MATIIEFVPADGGGTEEVRVAEREDAAVGRDEPVAAAGRRGGHADDRHVERGRAGGTEEVRVAEGEDPAVGRDDPVAVAGRRSTRCRRSAGCSVMAPVEPWKAASPNVKMPPSDATSVYPRPVGVAVIPTIGLFNVDRAGRAVEGRVAEREDAAVGRDEPIAAPGRRRRDPDDRLVQRDGAGGAVERRVAEREDPAVARDRPVAVARRGRGDADDRLVDARPFRWSRGTRPRQPEKMPPLSRHEPVARPGGCASELVWSAVLASAKAVRRGAAARDERGERGEDNTSGCHTNAFQPASPRRREDEVSDSAPVDHPAGDDRRTPSSSCGARA